MPTAGEIFLNEHDHYSPPELCEAEVMRTRTLILLALLVIIPGCVTYRDFQIVNPLPSPYEPAASPRCRQTVQFSYGLTGGGTFQWTVSGVFSPAAVNRALHEALQRYAGCRDDPALACSSETGMEVFVYVREKLYPWHWYGEYLGHISSVASFVIPFYINEGGWELSYSVPNKNLPKKTYKYEISARQFYWLALLPFSWINFFTYSLDDAVRSTTAQFVVDARQDGSLGTAE